MYRKANKFGENAGSYRKHKIKYNYLYDKVKTQKYINE